MEGNKGNGREEMEGKKGGVSEWGYNMAPWAVSDLFLRCY